MCRIGFPRLAIHDSNAYASDAFDPAMIGERGLGRDG